MRSRSEWQQPRTAGLPAGMARGDGRSHGAFARLARGFTGAVAAGLVVLTLVLVGAEVYSTQHATPGPGAEMIGGNAAAAVLAVLCQRIGDRWRGPRAAVPLLAVLTLAGATLWLAWWR